MKFLNEKCALEFLNEVNLNQFVDTFGQPWEDFPELYDEGGEYFNREVWQDWILNCILGKDDCKDEWTVLPDWAFRILCKIGPVLNCIPLTNLDDREKMEAEYNEAVEFAHNIAMELRYFEDNIDCGKTVGETDDAMNAIADELWCRPIEACLDKWAGYVVV